MGYKSRLAIGDALLREYIALDDGVRLCSAVGSRVFCSSSALSSEESSTPLVRDEIEAMTIRTIVASVPKHTGRKWRYKILKRTIIALCSAWRTRRIKQNIFTLVPPIGVRSCLGCCSPCLLLVGATVFFCFPLVPVERAIIGLHANIRVL